MKVLITGGSGLVGSALTEKLRSRGDTVGHLLRGQLSQRSEDLNANDVLWNPATGEMPLERVEGMDAIVNLAGASIADGRWTDQRKKVLFESRVQLTRNLVRNIARLRKPPPTVISASAVGYYGSRGDELLTEASDPGDDFLARLCRDWEAEAMKAEEVGARVAISRFGIVLSKNGGALPRMLFPFRLGFGGRLGSGKQWMSWIALDDVISALVAILDNPSLRGPINVVAPNPARNQDFTRALGRVLHRPTLFPAPATILKTLTGEMGQALLLSSQRVVPEKLTRARFTFELPELEAALQHAIQEEKLKAA